MGGHIGRPPAAGEAHRPAQQLNPVARPLGNLHIPETQLADALHGHPLRVDLAAEGQVPQNADLPPRVNTLHVGGGVRLGIALGLGLPEGVGEKGPGADHPGEDIVGGPVQNAVHLVDAVGRHALGQGVQHRDAAAHAGLEEVADILPLRQGQQLAALFRH